MSTHDCLYSNERLRARFKGIEYDISECEGCGKLGLLTGPNDKRRLLSEESAEYSNVMDFFEFLIHSMLRRRLEDSRDAV